MRRGNQSRRSSPISPPEIRVSSEPIVGESSGRPRGKVRRFLGKMKDATKRISRSKDSRTHDPNAVLPTVDHEGASSIPNVEVQDAPSSVDRGADPQLALLDAKEAAKHMNPLSGCVRSRVSAAQGAPAGLDAADNFQDTYLKPLRIFDTVIGKIAEVHPYAKMALGMLSCASKIVLAQADRDEAVLQLVDKLDRVYAFITQDETLGQISSMHIILGQISQQTLECAYFIRDYAETKNFWKRLGKNVVSETKDTIQQYCDVLDTLMENFRDQAIRDVALFVHRAGEILDLSGMTYAEGAGLDTGKECLPGTRTEILSQITDWVNSTGDDVPRVLWLSGPAGTGKSAIAHTIAKWSRDVGGLGSCYCFDHLREIDRRHEKIFSTIARDLADRDPAMRRALADAVQNETALKTTVDIIQQWQKLLTEPLRKLSGSTVRPVVIVIEALDESGPVETRRHLLRILSGKLAVPRITELPTNFRIIVTSRPLPDIEAELAGAPHILRMSMDDIQPAAAERDIHAYISKELGGLSHFGDKEFAALATKADGLFEWARLAYEYIKAPPTGFSPMDSFNALVSRDPAERANLLYDMYRLILGDTMQKDKSANTAFQQKKLARFHSVMGQILGASEPLPLNSLNVMRSHFPDKTEHYGVEVIVGPMGSLLSGTTNPSTPIRPLHASFSDFLTDQSHSGEFFIDVSKAQRNLAFTSLRVMEDGLRFNICDMKSSYIPNREDTGLQERVNTCITPHLSYSSRFWAAHVRATVFDAELAKEVRSFFDHERLLFWIELLGLIDALRGEVAALPLIAQWAKGHIGFKDISSIAMDVQRFIQVFGGMIIHSTPHLYVSALPFSPVNSISTKFAAKFPNILRLASERDVNWPTVLTVLRGHTREVTTVMFSPDGTRIATGSCDATVQRWDAATGQPVGEPLRGHTGWVNSVSFSPDGARIATGSMDKTVRLWDAATGQPIGEPLQGHTESVTSVSFSPDGTYIATTSEDNTIRLWITATGQPVGEPLRGHTESVTSVSFSPDGTRIATGSRDHTVWLWDAATGQPVGEPLQGHTKSVNSVSFSPDGTRLATGSSDETVRLWDTVTGQSIGEPFRGHTDSVNSVSFSPDGTRIATGSWDHTMRLWDALTGQPVGEPYRGHTDSVNSVSFSSDGTRIVTGSRDYTVCLWDALTGQPPGEPLRGHTNWVNAVSFSPDGTRFATASEDKTVQLWDTATGQPVGEPLRGHTESVNSVSFSPDGTRLATGSVDQTIWLWDAATGQPFGEPLRGHTSSVNSVSFSPDGNRLATGSSDETVRLWDTVTGQSIGEPLRGHTSQVSSVWFSPDGARIVTGSWDSTVRLWDAATGQPVGEPLLGHIQSVNSVSFSPDGTRIATGSLDKTVRLWDAATGQLVGEPLQGHTESVTSVAFSPDGTRIATGSWDSTIRLWVTATGQSVGKPLLGHTSSVNSVSFSQDGTRIVSCSGDHTVRVWYAVVGELYQESAESAFSDEGHIMHFSYQVTDTNSHSSTLPTSNFIRFSSNSIPELLERTNLFRDMRHVIYQLTTSFVGGDGWVLGPARELLLWVPPASREVVGFYNPRSLVIPRGCVELDLSCMARGQHWQNCRADS